MAGGGATARVLITLCINCGQGVLISRAAKRAEIVKPSASAPEGPPLLRGRMSRRSGAQRGLPGGEA